MDWTPAGRTPFFQEQMEPVKSFPPFPSEESAEKIRDSVEASLNSSASLLVRYPSLHTLCKGQEEGREGIEGARSSFYLQGAHSLSQRVLQVAFSRDGKHIVVLTKNSHLLKGDTTTGEVIAEIEAPFQVVYKVEPIAQDNFLMWGLFNNVCYGWNLKTQKRLSYCFHPKDRFYCSENGKFSAHWSHKERKLHLHRQELSAPYLFSEGKGLKDLRVSNLGQVAFIVTDYWSSLSLGSFYHEEPPQCEEGLPEESTTKKKASSSCLPDYALYLWNPTREGGFGMRSFEGHKKVIQSFVFAPRGKWLASGDIKGDVCVWNIRVSNKQSKLWRRLSHFYPITDLQFDLAGNLLVSSTKNRVYLWDTQRSSIMKIFDYEDIPIRTLRLKNFDQELVVFTEANQDRMSRGFVEDKPSRVLGRVDTWNIQKTPSFIYGQSHKESIRSVFCTPDNRVVSIDNHAVFLRDEELCAQRCVEFSQTLQHALVTPRGNLVITEGDKMGYYLLSSLEKEPQEYLEHLLQDVGGYISSLAFSPDEVFLAVGNNNGVICVWNVQAKNRVGVIRSPLFWLRENIYSLCFSFDGKKLFFSQEEKKIILWDVVSREVEEVIDKLFFPVTALSVDRENTFLVGWEIGAGIVLVDLHKKVVVEREENPHLTVFTFCPRTNMLAFAEGETVFLRRISHEGITYLSTRLFTSAIKDLRNGKITSLAFSACGGFLVGASEGRFLSRWNLADVQ